MPSLEGDSLVYDETSVITLKGAVPSLRKGTRVGGRKSRGWIMEMVFIDKLDVSSLNRAPGKHREIDRDRTIRLFGLPLVLCHYVVFQEAPDTALERASYSPIQNS